MRLVATLLGGMLVVAAGCDGGPATHPSRPVVLWQSGRHGPVVPVMPEARWAPVYQKLRCMFEAKGGRPDRWTCFTGGDLGTVLAYYEKRFGLRPGEVAVRTYPAIDTFRVVRKVAAELGHPVPPGRAPRGMIRVAVLGPARGLPRVRLESPYLDLESGRPRHGTLISIRWRPRKESP